MCQCVSEHWIQIGVTIANYKNVTTFCSMTFQGFYDKYIDSERRVYCTKTFCEKRDV